MQIVDPGHAILGAFQSLIGPLVLMQGANERECSVLAQTRDLLLPKLLSGEIRLAEAERTVEAVA